MPAPAAGEARLPPPLQCAPGPARRAAAICRHLAVRPLPRLAPARCGAGPKSEDAAAGPLAGIRIVDLSTQVAGPAASQLLADQGADVVKVEPFDEGPVMGDPGRGNDGTNIRSAIFSVVNRNKRSIALNLKVPEGVALLKRLVATADVVLQNFRPGVVQRLGVSYEDLKAVKPDLIYLSSSGFGSSGPYADRRAYDPVVQAVAGLASMQQDETGRPRMMRVIVPDKVTALTSAQAISTALVQKARTGRGCHIELSMLDAVVALTWPENFAPWTFVREGEDLSERGWTYTRDTIFKTKDGYVTVAAIQQKEWLALCDALDRPSWKEDPRFRTHLAREKNRQVRLDMTEEVLRELPTAEVMRRMRAHDIPAAAVNHPLHRVMQDEQVRANGLVVEYDAPGTPSGRVRQARAAAQFSGAKLEVRRPAPLLGQHTAELLEELGVDRAAAQGLHERGVVKLS